MKLKKLLSKKINVPMKNKNKDKGIDVFEVICWGILAAGAFSLFEK